MLTVACVWIKSDTYRTEEWVLKLRSMVARRMGMIHPYQFICITKEDLSQHGIPTVKPRIKVPGNVPLWWHKLNLFSLEAPWVLYFDLDVVLTGHLGELVDFPSDFCVAPSNGVPMRGHDFNSSVMMFRTDSDQARMVKHLVTDSHVPFTKFAGDQQWLASLPMRVDLFPSRWVHKYLPGQGVYLPPEGTKVVLMIQGGKNKVLLEAGHEWIGEYWK